MSEVTEEMLKALAEHFRNGSAPARGTPGYYRARTPVAYAVEGPVLLHVPGIREDVTLVGTDGSSDDHEGVGGFAAVRGDGWALAGAFRGDVMNSHTCEAQGIRFGLRLVPDGGGVLVRLDAEHVIWEVQRLVDGLEVRPGPIRDWDALEEIVWHVRGRGLRVALQRIPDAEGGTDPRRIPSDPLMGAAHRLAWAARRLLLEGRSLRGVEVERLRALAASSLRWSDDLRAAWNGLLR